MRWWRRLRGGVWKYTRGWYQGSHIYMWVREPCSIPSTVEILKVEDYRKLPRAKVNDAKR